MVLAIFGKLKYIHLSGACSESENEIMESVPYGDDDSACATVVDQIMSLSPHPPSPPREQ